MYNDLIQGRNLGKPGKALRSVSAGQSEAPWITSGSSVNGQARQSSKLIVGVRIPVPTLANGRKCCGSRGGLEPLSLGSTPGFPTVRGLVNRYGRPVRMMPIMRASSSDLGWTSPVTCVDDQCLALFLERRGDGLV